MDHKEQTQKGDPLRTMRQLTLMVVVLGVFTLLLSCKGPSSSSERYFLPHIGAWTGVDAANSKAAVVFGVDGTGTMEFGGDLYSFQYVFDYSRKPVWLDFIYTREGKPFRAKLIVQFIDNNKLKWFTFFSEERPAEFPKEGAAGVMVLTRVNPLTKT